MWARYILFNWSFVQDLIEGAGEQNEEAIMKVTAHLLSIAKRHGCYKVMWTICCDVNDSELLRNIMV